jgi:hypothetical protein
MLLAISSNGLTLTRVLDAWRPPRVHTDDTALELRIPHVASSGSAHTDGRGTSRMCGRPVVTERLMIDSDRSAFGSQAQ